MAERRTITIAGRAISTMLAASGQNDVLRTYFVSQRDGVDYNLAYIGADFVAPEKKGEFDQAYMRALYDYGYQQAKAGKEMAQGAARPWLAKLASTHVTAAARDTADVDRRPRVGRSGP